MSDPHSDGGTQRQQSERCKDIVQARVGVMFVRPVDVTLEVKVIEIVGHGREVKVVVVRRDPGDVTLTPVVDVARFTVRGRLGV